MNTITSEQIDILRELIGIGAGRAANALNEMVNYRVILEVPFVKVLTPEKLLGDMDELGRSRVAAVKLSFKGPFSGTAALVFPPDSASTLVSVLTGEGLGTPDLNTVMTGTLNEVGNIVINGVMGSMGNVLKQKISYSIPSYIEDTLEQLLKTEDVDQNPTVLLVRTRFKIQQLAIEGDILLLFEVGSFDTLVSAISNMRVGPGEGA